MNQQLVSICIPTYNSEKYLEQTLNSILKQTYNNIEIIIGDNASTDNTHEVIKKFKELDPRIKYYINDYNLGYSKNCNKLISVSNGEFIAIYHSDDIYNLKIVEKQVDILNNNLDLLGVFCSFETINDLGDSIKTKYFPNYTNQYLIKINFDNYINNILTKGASFFCCPTSMIRKEVYATLNGYDENLKYIEDQDMWARILLSGNLAIINESLIKYRIHDYQGSSIYKIRSIEKRSIPLDHIIHFLEIRALSNKYKELIFKAEAADDIKLAKVAAKTKNYELFEN